MMHHDRSSLRRFAGPEANEVFLLCRPGGDDIARQTESAYVQMRSLLESEGGGLEHVVHETVYFRDIRADLPSFRSVRERVLGEAGGVFRPSSTFIEQPPLSDGVRVEISASAVFPHARGAAGAWEVCRTSPCACGDCVRLEARVIELGGQRHLRGANIYGSGANTFAEAYNMFCAAEKLLQEAGMNFHDVARTWIYLRDIDRDYDDLNRARRDFFEAKGITLRPASTGINGAPFARGHNFSLSLYAITSPQPLEIGVMTTPTLNEAWMYGSDFSRGLKVVEANKVALYVSGTASVDEQGRTAHVGNFDAQVERMIVNVSTLLAAQNASPADMVSATTYLKSATDAPRLRAILQARGFDGFPNALVKAPVCRPDLLCEMEAIAALPRPRTGS